MSFHFLDQFWTDPNWYNFISGPLANVTLFAAVIVWWRKHTCHVHGCPRIGRHLVEGTPYTVCRKHHPDDHLLAEHVLDAAERAKTTAPEAPMAG